MGAVNECRMGKTQKRNAKKAAREEAAKRKRVRHKEEAKERAQAAAVLANRAPCHQHGLPEPEKEEAPPVVVEVKKRDRVKDAIKEKDPLDVWSYTGARQATQKRNLSEKELHAEEQARIKRVKLEKKRINDRVIGYSK